MLTGVDAAGPPSATERVRPLKLMFLLPFPPDLQGSHGGTRATAAMIDMLSEDHRVCVVYLTQPGAPPPRQMPAKCERLIGVPKQRPARPRTAAKRWIDTIGGFLFTRPRWVDECWSRSMVRHVAEIAADFRPDVVHHEFHVMAQYIPIVRSACPGAACIVTEHEPGISADARPGASPTLRERCGALSRRRSWQRYERRALSKADAIIVFTSADAAALKRLLGPGSPPVTVIALRLPQDSRSQVGDLTPVKSDFLFVGNFGHPPNADAARRLVQAILPKILRELPDATLAIVGADPPQDVLDAGSDRMIVTGWVDDPSVYLAGADVVLVPLRQGGGLRVKMLEACAAGKAIVASAMAVEGLSLSHGKDVVLAESDEEFAANAVALKRDAAARAGLEAASRRWWEAQQDVGQWSAEYAAFYATLTRRDPRHGPPGGSSR